VDIKKYPFKNSKKQKWTNLTNKNSYAYQTCDFNDNDIRKMQCIVSISANKHLIKWAKQSFAYESRAAQLIVSNPSTPAIRINWFDTMLSNLFLWR